MAAWNYTLEPLTDDQRRNYTTLGWACSAHGCRKHSTHCATYTPAPGQSSDTSEHNTLMCHEHAAEFAAEHDLPIGPAAP